MVRGFGSHPEYSLTSPVKPPKLPKSAKQDLILTHLRATGTCHTLKDLEKTLPSVASINGIQVKEYIQALTDEGQLRVEKIGSGNWYWAFCSDEKHERERQLARMRTDVEKTRKSCADAEAGLAAETLRREQDTNEDEGQRGSLMARKAELQAAVDRVRSTEAQLTGRLNLLNDKGTKQVQEEIAGFRQEALQWTDNIYILEGYMHKLSGDRQMVDSLLRECYGDEYVDGGLDEL
jgi:hypothetical protein